MKELHIVKSCKYIISFAVHLFFFFHLTTCGSINVPSDKIFLNCGSSGPSSFNGVNWIGDIGSSFLPPAYDKSSSTLLISKAGSGVPNIPYSTARIVRSPFTYSFPISPGLRFIRLYFISTSYLLKYENPSKAYFSVKTGPYTLVSNFNPSVAAQDLNLAYFTKDFLVNVSEEKLNITIIPSPLISNAFAFVNGIEIFTVPISIYFQGSKVHIPHLGNQEPFIINDKYALEMLYRVDVGTDSDQNTVDVENAFGTWLEDFDYISGSQFGSILNTNRLSVIFTYNTSGSYGSNYSAPEELYLSARTMGSYEDTNTRYNLTWSFPVDSGFKYLVRLHFCEISMEITRINQRVFKVYINNQTAEESMDLVALAGAPFVGLHRDYVVMVPMESERRQHMWIALHPNMESKPKYADAILNGIEIIKLSDSNHNLAASFQLKKEQKEKRFPLVIVLAGTLGAILGLFITFFILIRRAWKKRKLGTSQKLPLNSIGKDQKIMQVNVTSGQCKQFTLAEISIATSNFSEALVIGEGGFGKVYKGFIHDGVTLLAIKRCNPSSRQGFKEFQNEINFFSFCHMNLVSLLGYCQEDNELILVYEYMDQGSLRDHLYMKQNQPLPWNQRLKICVGAARGLHYLHTGTRNPVIHRDIKSGNILLDHNWVPKIADFGLSRIVPSICHTHVSTEVKGTFGYLDPEYYKRRKLTEKSDVYSFGVVLFEVLCGRPAVNPKAVEEESEKVGLAEWALHCQQSGTIDRLVDPHLESKIRSECLTAFVDIGIQCLTNKSAERPTMGEVLSNLEKILSMEESLDEQELNNYTENGV